MPPRVGGVVLAAGAGRRMGFRPKALLLRDGEPLLLRQVRLLALAKVAPIVVVLGHHAEQLRPVLEQSAFGAATRIVTNPAPDVGPASSLRCALAVLPSALDAVLVVLGDQPLLELGDIEAVLNAWRWRAEGMELVVPVHGNAPGHPLALGETVRAAVEGGEPVRDWRRNHPEQVQALRAPHVRYTTDVDTPEAMDRLAQEHGVTLAWDA
ncbi:MAG: nucleotidyltransferase family protein [Comamonadaceae bacterium]|nr:nucleotidyltransferase family protein [Burkholderiales bacterium]MEB2347938.1 nucleotidyltransferase family protein [Comamonadaceae bacterium]